MARRSSNTQRIGGLSHCVGCGVTQKKEECTPMGTRGVSQCFGCGVVDEGEVDIDDGNFYCFTCWLAYYAARARSPNLRARLLQDATHVQPARNLQGVAYAPGSAQHERSVGTSLRHSDDDLSCSGPARARNINEPAHRSPRKQRLRVAVKPSSLKSEVGIRARTPTPVTALWKRVTEVTALWRGVTRVTALWRGVKNTLTRTSM